MKKVTVIVPVYNVEKYLPKCIESILAQTYTEFELILVDDGSTDHSGSICDAYAVKDPRINVVHQRNKGVSTARNIGLDMAKGDYIGFVDADDYIAPDMYETMVSAIENTKAEIAECEANFVSESGKFIYCLTNKRKKISVLNSKEALYVFPSNKVISYSMCNKLFSASILKKTNIRCCPQINVLEDCLFICETLFNIKKCVLLPNVFYYYVMRKNSAMHSIFSDKNMEAIESMKKCVDLYENKEPKLASFMRGRLALTILKLLLDAMDADLQQQKIDGIYCLLKEINNYDVSFISKIKIFLCLKFKNKKLLLVLRKIYHMIKYSNKV